MKVKYSLVYNRRAKKLGAHDKAPVQVEIYFDRDTRRWLNTNVDIASCYWDAVAKNIKKTHPNYIGLYQHLKQLCDDLERFELSLLNQGRSLTPELLDMYQHGSKDSFVQFSRALIDEALNQKKMSSKSHTRYTSTLNLLEKIMEGDIMFSNVNEEMVKKIDTYLAKNSYEQTTIGRFHVSIKMFIKAAVKKGYIDHLKDPYADYELDRGKSERTNLEPDELIRLENLDSSLLTGCLLEQALDQFLYSCYTGLRIGDSLLLSKEHVKQTSDGLVVDMVTEKGGGRRVVHHLAHLFNGKPQAILQKYLDRYPDTPTIFPQATDQAINRSLKTIAHMAGISKNLTFHMSRHTCGTALADLTANPYLIMDILGHAEIRTSMIYIHSSSERIRKQLMQVKWDW